MNIVPVLRAISRQMRPHQTGAAFLSQSAYMTISRRSSSFWTNLKMRARKSFFPFRPLPTPPMPPMKPSVSVIHNQRRIDNFSWLEDHRDQSVIEYLVAENNYTDSVMESTAVFQDQLYSEMASRVYPKEETIPEVIDNYAYYMKLQNGGDDMHVYCRRKIYHDGTLGSEEHLLDLNRIISRFDYKYVSLGVVKLSHNHERLAFTIDNSGSETFMAFVVDLTTYSDGSANLMEGIPNAVSIEWASDCKTLFYTVANSVKRPYRLYRHVVGTDVSNDVLVYEEQNDRFILDVSRTKDKAFITINSNSRTCSEVRVVNAFNPDIEPLLIHEREPGLEYYVDHRGDCFYIVTNADGAVNYKVVSVPEQSPWKTFWKDIVATKTDVKIEDMDIFENFCVLYEKSQGLPNVRVVSLVTNREHNVPLPESICVLEPGANQNFQTDILRFSISSPLTPLSTFNYNMKERILIPLKKQQIAGFPTINCDDYICERLFAYSTDGVEVPITVVKPKFVFLDGRNPMLVSAYGSYGISVEPDFNSERLSLLSRGWILAFAHVRGGSEMGRSWYEDAKGLHKQRSFEDFEACIRYLYSKGYSSRKLTAAKGVSAGGLLVAASCMRESSLVSCAILKVPYVDVLTAMLNPELPLTIHEYEEWGDPSTDIEAYNYIKSYSPYEKMSRSDYPAMLVTASMKDTRVSYWQPAKFVAKLRNLKSDNNTLLLKTDWASGHFGTAGCHNFLREIAFEYAFLHFALGIEMK